MSMYDEEYRIGYEEGRIIGRIEVCLSMVSYVMNHKITNNYEEAFKLFEISEEDSARMMDYLPVRSGEWIILSESEWEKRKDDLSEKFKKSFSNATKSHKK